MNELSLNEIFQNHKGFRVHKWDHYLNIYEKYFSKYQGKDINFLEIGVAHGGSLELWKKYFGPGSYFYGIDIIPECKQFEKDNVKIFIGSQGSHEFLKSIINDIPQLDILLDDGGHFVKDQVITFEYFWDKIKIGGFYICEDIHTSYWFSFGGGYKRKGTFIEFVKDLIDEMHGWHSHQPEKFGITKLTKEIKGIYIFNSIIIIEKGTIDKPTESIKGYNQVPEPGPQIQNFFIKAYNKWRKILMGFRKINE